MDKRYEAPWHRRSWDRFIAETLPQLLGSRMPLVAYEATETAPALWRVRLAVKAGDAAAEAVWDGLPGPDAEGAVCIDGDYRVVMPTASSADLENAQIRCIGEQLLDFIDQRLGEAGEDLPWDAALLRSWAPLGPWFEAFYDSVFYGYLQMNNWIDRVTHLRRLLIPQPEAVYHPSQMGRACPFALPEGPNIGKIREVALGAEIRDGRLLIVDDSPAGHLGVNASMIPLLEHDDANRLLMGANMMRQWRGAWDPALPMHGRGPFRQLADSFQGAAVAAPEPALVQTGAEPETPYFWCGRNLLTAFIAWDEYGFEDAVVVSESCACRMASPLPLEPGDKLSNRHGSKGVVSQVLPDEDMPCLKDGTPVELVFSLGNIVSRQNFGQVREALCGRIARAEGRPVLAPAFGGPAVDELKERAAKAGLAADGMEQLSLDGEPLSYRSTVGWVYWGCTIHVARDKLTTLPGDEGPSLTEVLPTGQPARLGFYPPQGLGEVDYQVLRQEGALHTAQALFSLQAAERGEEVERRWADSTLEQMPAPAPQAVRLIEGLAAAGIEAVLAEDGLRLGFAPPAKESMPLARPVPHPWSAERLLGAVGGSDPRLEAAAGRLARMIDSGAPDNLQDRALQRLEAAVADYLDRRVGPAQMRLGGQVRFSGNAVLVPGPELAPDEVGLPEDMAWGLFGPLAASAVGEDAVKKRSDAATAAVDRLMAQYRVLVYKPSILWRVTAAFAAFKPRRQPGRALRLHPFCCGLFDADFDGDQGGVILPLTAAAQDEAESLLTLEAHVRRNPQLLRSLHMHMGLWGLAQSSRTPEGRQAIEKVLGAKLADDAPYCDKHWVYGALADLCQRDGAAAAIAALDRLRRLGAGVARRSGASMGPFLGEGLKLPAPPATADEDLWRVYEEEVKAALVTQTAPDDPALGPVLLSCLCGARGATRQLANYVGGRTLNPGPSGVGRGFAQGLKPDEMFATVRGAREGLAQANLVADEGATPPGGSGVGLLARARRVGRPGLVFARAAASGEVDPLNETDARLFMGLGPR